MTVLRLRDGERWAAAAPAWSTLSAVGWFSLAKAGHRFDRHFHDCAEYWAFTEGRAQIAVGGDLFDAGPGDLVCTPAGVEHDIVRAYTDNVMLLFIEEAVPPGGTAGHRHRDPRTAWHIVPRAESGLTIARYAAALPRRRGLREGSGKIVGTYPPGSGG